MQHARAAAAPGGDERLGNAGRDLGFAEDLNTLAEQIKAQKQQQKLARLSPFWAKRQVDKEKSARQVLEQGGPKTKRTDEVDMSELKNLRQLTATVPSMERCMARVSDDRGKLTEACFLPAADTACRLLLLWRQS